MKPDTHTVKQLFERDICYLVPLYQRPYVWNEEEQWAPLWDDVNAILVHQEDSGDAALWSHFLGAIVLDQEKTAPGRIPRYTIIDGQQRLTTLQLLIAAVARAAADAGAARDAKLLRRLVENDPLEVKDDELLKVWPTNANRVSFAAVVQADGPPLGHVNDADNLIDEAFEYFTRRATEYLLGDDSETASQETVYARAELLRIVICDLLKAVSITLEKDDNAQVIFETLNARGTPLLSLDLVKNSVFRQASVQGRDTDSLYEHVWRPQLDDDYWRQGRRQGRLNRPIGELFLMHWLTMRLERVIPATELFAAFRQGVLSAEVDAEALVRELCRDAAIMRSFDTVDPHTPEGQFFARFGPLDAGTVLPIVLLLFRSLEIAVDRRRRALSIIESWLARRVLMRMTTKNYNRFVPRLVARVKADLVHADEALHAVLVGNEAGANRWPADEEFIDFLVTRDAYGVVAQPRLVMALTAVEASLRTSKTEPATIPSGLSLEHLLPQQWEAHWPLPTDEPEQHVARQAALHKIGNLTIVTGGLNSTLRNSAWHDKKAALNQHSVLLLNARLVDRGSWTEAAIEERSRWLATRLVTIWPGPNSDVWKARA